MVYIGILIGLKFCSLYNGQSGEKFNIYRSSPLVVLRLKRPLWWSYFYDEFKYDVTEECMIVELDSYLHSTSMYQ